MALAQRIGSAARDILLGISAYARADGPLFGGVSLDAEEIDALRARWNGALAAPSQTQTRWYQSDLENAEHAADGGDLRAAARLMHAARKDGHLAGVLSTRTGGLVRLPKKFRGDARVTSLLEVGHESTRSVFDETFPPSELALLASDGLLLGVGVAELLPVRGRAHPVLVRLDPQYLRYIWTENQWYYSSLFGMLPITPGDGRWVLHTPGGRVAPWQAGLWRAIGQAWIRKQHAALHKDNWEAKLANPARVAVASAGAAEPQKQSFFQSVMAWGVNTVFGLTPGYDVKLIESNGRGWESFNETIRQSNEEFVLAIAGQTVTTDGGTGFANADVHKSIRADLIKETADGLAHTLNTQGLPAFVSALFGIEQVMSMPCSLEWNVTPPKDRNAEATAMVSLGNAVETLGRALAPAQLQPDIRQLADNFGVPTLHVAPQLRLVSGDAASVDAGADTAGEAVADTALNGAQIASLLEVVTAVAQGQIPRDAAIGIIKRAFQVDEAAAEDLLGSVGLGFVPTSEAAE